MIVTPISHLSLEDHFLETVLAVGELEGRDHSVLSKHIKHVILYHSELELHLRWSESCKDDLIKELNKYHNLRAVSFHMVTCFAEYILERGVAHGVGARLSADTMLHNAHENCNWLKKSFPTLKILVENNNDLGSEAYKTVTDPKFISKIVLGTDIHFLYDHAHAMISAYNQRISLDEYVDNLPTQRLLQIHFSEPAFIEGKAIDFHDMPSSEQLEFCKFRFQNIAQYLTVEFYKSLTDLQFCLRNLKEYW